MDSTNTEYAGIYDNGTNLWIGANKTNDGIHHTGLVCISSGYDVSGNPNDTIRIINPSKNGTESTGVSNKSGIGNDLQEACGAAHGAVVLLRLPVLPAIMPLWFS